MSTRPKIRWRIFPKSARRGAAVVEFALIAPLFFLLLAGIIEFGQAFRIQHLLSNAARRGCRAAIVDGTTSSQVQQNVRLQCAQTLGVAGENFTVEIAVDGNSGANLSQAGEGTEISVTVSIPFNQAGAGFFASTFLQAPLSSTCVMERE